MNVSTHIELYLSYRYNLSARTRAIYREHLERLAAELDDPPLQQVTTVDLVRFMARLRRRDGRRYSPGFLDQVWRSLHTFFVFCAEEGWLETNVMHRVPRPRGIEAGRKPRLTLDQVRIVRDAILDTDTRRFDLVDRNLSIFLLMVDSGLRLGEVAGLRARDVFLEEKTVSVLSRKTSQRRDVPIGTETVKAISNYLDRRRPVKSGGETLFLTARGAPITVGAIHLLMKRLQRRVGFPLHAHLLRHTFANLYIRRGKAPRLQKILGHSRIDTTIRFYTDPEYADIQAEHGHASPLAQLSQR